jgi:hypothetical protein
MFGGLGGGASHGFNQSFNSMNGNFMDVDSDFGGFGPGFPGLNSFG